MKRYQSAAGAVVGAAALVVSSLLVAAPAAHAQEGGTLVVHIVDQYGRPTPGIVDLYRSESDYPDYGPEDASASGGTETFTSIDEGGYAVVSVTPWSGAVCAGLSPCTPEVGGPSSVSATPVVTVNDGAVTNYTMHVTVPSITGGRTVGSTLSLHIPQGLTALDAYGAGYAGYAGSAGAQWMRGTTAISGATGTSYTTAYDDGSRAMSVRLTASPLLALIFAESGMSSFLSSSTFSTNAITMAKAIKTTTTTKVKVAKRIDADEPASAKVKVTSGAGVPTGYVTLKVGKFKAKKTLKHGTVFITLPHLRAGKYKLVTKFHGLDHFAASKAKKAKLTVH